MILVQVADLIERSRVDCGLPAYTTNTAITSAIVLDFVKRSAQKLAGLVQQYGADQQYLTLVTTLTTTANVNTVSLPANSLDVERIALVTDGTGEIMLTPADKGDWNPSPGLWDAAWNSSSAPLYSIQGNTITLYPTPPEVRDLRVYYSAPFSVVATSDYLSLRPNWDEWIVASVNVMIRNRLKEDASNFLQALGLSEQSIIGQLKRDRAGVRQIRDVRGSAFGDCHRRGRWW